MGFSERLARYADISTEHPGRKKKYQKMCVYQDDVVSAVLGGCDGNFAPKCSMFHRAEDGYWYRDREKAEKNLEKYKEEE